MEMWTSLLIVLAVFALGDVISILTKARISSLFVIMMTFLILFLTHTIPPDIVKRAGLETLGPIAIGMLLVNMGSSVDVRMLKREWRSVVGSIISMIIAVVSCLAMIPLIGRENALASAPVINGGVIATNTMVAAALEKGLPLTAALAAFLYATQKFVGTLPASYFGLRAARHYLADFRRAKKDDPTFVFASQRTENNPWRQTFAERHERHYTAYICLFIGALCSYVGFWGGVFTHKWVGLTIWCMLFGIGLRALGLVPPNFMKNHGVSTGFFMFGVLTVIVPSLAKVDLSMLPQLGFFVACVFALTLLGIVVVFKVLPVWKIVGDRDLAIGIAMCQMIGYPGTQLISDEIAKTVGETDEEVDYLSTRIGTAYVISGFTSVTIFSIIVASIMAHLL
ncbi:MAG: hypothetical protein SOU94_09065 [Acidaminococcus sp.]|uniref:Uncharacterized protein n=2 Tax=Acidaminococcus intestini TaxID=187327 RepID=A0A943ECW5_9FIRM|nr:hypothetical protein [Acidaminococcus sp.]MBS5519341.1 hypothetical protein [Acidaminococcus intestini]MDY2739966.1 hypothetical protein [Acidaminococcus sp.]